jgi:hypothetical protein
MLWKPQVGPLRTLTVRYYTAVFQRLSQALSSLPLLWSRALPAACKHAACCAAEAPQKRRICLVCGLQLAKFSFSSRR